MESIDLSSNEDITQFTDEEQVDVNQINQEFVQENKLKGEAREFTIFNDSQCYQSVRLKHGGKYKFRANLTYLNAKPKRSFDLAEGWLITAAITAIFSFLLVYLRWFSQIQMDKQILTMALSLSITFTLIAFMVGLLKTRDRILFYSKFGHVPVLELMNYKPDRESFKQFIDQLSSYIIKAQHAADLSATDALVMELKELRRLKDETVIAESQYEQAKKKILQNKAFTSSH
ncbi:MAG: hypothetical protein QNJ56_09200 [Gammaproteobacteria bacterium]|nr:hypothetical protein [Gammaproteobacteria bacterium]